ncbi:serine aminopeptidase domain-containing protein [Wenzhouxiangella marina]|uniref:Lecithin:cholesterol acyltransferase n=1 Tax=Wenzhouxiangella marina TaxID=1579979 RepID=A0A0K0XVX0_9GAMM|nr:alpha/beta hydrolase [Wenzhouxiangella marina]AKS41854.1 lecithin:cholesterol acyltransferase [Wenzhouxiangella marina]MBB6086380.1 pimeloyl-ACP methyl ester carboxylesterase [Wenzhouxiangella marina]
MKRWRRRLLLFLAIGLLASSFWVLWAESQPQQEHWLRSQAQAQLQSWFPEAMQPLESEVGFHPRPSPDEPRARVVLLHGLDEPGGLFVELIPALTSEGYEAIEFRYPNDQAVSESADLLAMHWEALPANRPVVLLGHSMGGLVIRDFVTRSGPSWSAGPQLAGVLMLGTPNQGSDWARLRVWLELRDRLGDDEQGDFALFAGLRDGTGAAKIDLRPDSHFLRELNRRSWPQTIPLAILGGRLTPPPEQLQASLANLDEATGHSGWADGFAAWLRESGEGLGDGVVPVASLAFPGSPSPDLVQASHRGLLVSGPMYDGRPPGIAWTLAQIESLLD